MQFFSEKSRQRGKRETRANEELACKVPLKLYENVRANRAYMKDKFGCENDAIKSMTLCKAPKDTKITLYDDDELGEEDDFVIVATKEDMEGCETISTFEETNDVGVISVDYKKNDGLDGKVSSFKVEFGMNSNFSILYFWVL